jgi:hypothetical protein
MKQIAYAMQFKGSGAPKRGKKNEMSARSGSSTSSLTNSVGARGPRLAIKDGARPKAAFKSNVQVLKKGEFTEDGTIDFGKGGKLRFSTIGKGWMGPSAEEGVMHGGILWKVDSGTGPLRGATGIITSNFTITDKGEVTDNQWGVLYIK